MPTCESWKRFQATETSIGRQPTCSGCSQCCSPSTLASCTSRLPVCCSTSRCTNGCQLFAETWQARRSNTNRTQSSSKAQKACAMLVDRAAWNVVPNACTTPCGLVRSADPSARPVTTQEYTRDMLTPIPLEFEPTARRFSPRIQAASEVLFMSRVRALDTAEN